MDDSITAKSKFLSLILRHKPETIGIKLDAHGWADVDELLEKMNLDRSTLELIVDTDSKRRYSFDEAHERIRANQGHSINVDVELKHVIPQDTLYHGTGLKNVESIWHDGLKPMSRLYVHLSKDYATAKTVGARHGEPVVFTVDAKAMVKDGIEFLESENGVILTKAVSPQYLAQLGY